MIKKQAYKKTPRFSNIQRFIITEKVDGGNLFFTVRAGELFIGMRNYIFSLHELNTEFNKDRCVLMYNGKGVSIYKGLYEWLQEHGEDLQNKICENSVVCGEWLGFQENHPYEFEQMFVMFGKANLDQDFIFSFSLVNYNYRPENYKYAFKDEVLPDYIATVPVVQDGFHDMENQYSALTVSYLDKLYDTYSEVMGRKIEGFVVTQPDTNSIRKYVREKRGTKTDHLTPEAADVIKRKNLEKAGKTPKLPKEEQVFQDFQYILFNNDWQQTLRESAYKEEGELPMVGDMTDAFYDELPDAGERTPPDYALAEMMAMSHQLSTQRMKDILTKIGFKGYK